MIYKVFSSLLVLSLMLGLISCEKNSSAPTAITKEGYLQLDVIVNPMIHPYAQAVNFSLDAVRLGDYEAKSLAPTDEMHFDAAIEPERQQLGSRELLVPGGYSNVELDLAGAHLINRDCTIDLLKYFESSVKTLPLDGSFLIENGSTTKRVILLDLNKIVSTHKNGQVDFSLRENTSAGDHMRLYDPKKVGHIVGRVTRTAASPRQTYKLVVYAYPVGEFDQAIETRNGFASAFISTNVRRNDLFSFPVLPQGAYDLVIAHYEDNDQNDILEFKELLQADATVRADIRMTRVSANTETSIELMLGGTIAN